MASGAVLGMAGAERETEKVGVVEERKVGAVEERDRTAVRYWPADHMSTARPDLGFGLQNMAGWMLFPIWFD